MQPDWDAVDEDDGDDGMRSGPSPQQVRISIQDVLATMFAIQSAGGPQSPDHGGSRNTGISGFNLQDISRWFIGRGGATRGLALNDPDADGEEDDYDYEDDDDDYHALFNTSSRTSWKGPETTEPQKEGVELLNSGDFGRVGNKAQKRRNKTNIANIILNRTRRIRPVSNKEDYAANLIPNSNGASVAACEHNIYTGQYSADSSFYYTCSQDFRLHVFDTTKPPIRHGTARLQSYPGLQTNMKVRKCIQGHLGQWTITDANLSPDNERMIYSSITPTVYMTNILDDSQVQTPIPFSDPRASNRRALIHDESFGIWSCRFSADGNEVVAGGSKKIFVYDLLANRRTVKINAHTDDVNSCCWADTASGNVLVSASDDTFIKVWDRRSLGASQKPSGILIGHTEGLTYVSAKGDGRYIVSNGKDQAMRLWDLRKMRSNQDFDAVRGTNYGLDFDYRYPPYPGPRVAKHPKDCSVMTYYGHSVMRTLIRCHFSPTETTGAQYLYSGSADGRIHIWSLDGRVVQVLDRSKTLSMSFDPSQPELPSTRSRNRAPCVRDVSWHSEEPVMMSAAWENSMNGSTVARHEWKGLLRMQGALEDWVEKNTLEGEESSRRRSVRLRNQRRVPGAFEEGENAEDTE
ncbi:LEC14B protein [Termitomyces sp. T112]|nr:LEC14B protein [Termitomyces sp. T112]